MPLTTHAPRRLLPALVLTVAVAAVSGQSADVAIAIDAGGTPQVIARFDGGRWVKTADVLQCAHEGDAERVVVTGTAGAEMAQRVAPTADGWKALEQVIVRVFEQRQREHALVARNLTGVPIQIDSVYAAPDRDALAAVYYFEASRRVPDPGTAPEEDPKGTLRVAVSGWLHHHRGGSVTALGSKSDLGWEQDRSGDSRPVRGPDLTPLGVVAHDSGWIWVMKGRAGDIGWVTAYLVRESGVRTLADPARCAR